MENKEINTEDIINKAKKYIKDLAQDEYTGHDYYHALRVYNIATNIYKYEKKGNIFIIQLASLLHDAIDYKIQNNLNKTIMPFDEFMDSLNLKDSDKESILYIINNMSFHKMYKNNNIKITDDLAIVSDADKIDALGAIGIARAFAYGAYKKNLIYDPDIKSDVNISNEEYNRTNRKSSSLNHFDEKLFKLEHYIITERGKQIASERTKYMKEYKEKFLLEWSGEI